MSEQGWILDVFSFEIRQNAVQKVSFCAETISDLRWERTRDTQEETVDDREAGAGAARAPRWLTFPYKREKKWGPQVHLYAMTLCSVHHRTTNF